MNKYEKKTEKYFLEYYLVNIYQTNKFNKF